LLWAFLAVSAAHWTPQAAGASCTAGRAPLSSSTVLLASWPLGSSGQRRSASRSWGPAIPRGLWARFFEARGRRRPAKLHTSAPAELGVQRAARSADNGAQEEAAGVCGAQGLLLQDLRPVPPSPIFAPRFSDPQPGGAAGMGQRMRQENRC
jgi:hypothetical protein